MAVYFSGIKDTRDSKSRHIYQHGLNALSRITIRNDTQICLFFMRSSIIKICDNSSLINYSICNPDDDSVYFLAPYCSSSMLLECFRLFSSQDHQGGLECSYRNKSAKQTRSYQVTSSYRWNFLGVF